MKRGIFISVGMGLFLSIVMSVVMILLFVGYSDQFFKYLLESVVLGFAISFPISLILPNLLNKLADRWNIK
ncbi:DUF2798 domain-containing protein [Enterococcus pallens]|uniref:Uncharacterized protein n=1 Tax=Enterococcus pallens ATCC BAA-351 TaxID=1158607 RepID=R2QCT5_9ENTE|nr:DUF2798 domain-containing protein [Enterococcus pallens]EOH94242.1 hypothetical protein UAU_01977 [Enterococcus pallens ATCC BAA-351]EOU24121.1 hypothetical protein I588_00108 [Enterococcus pallens ATCC BAA-351]